MTPHGHPEAFEVDHLIEVARLEAEGRPEVALEPSLWEASHSLCNTKRASGGPGGDADDKTAWDPDLKIWYSPDLGRPSEIW
jgi:hypothetical protein